MAKNNNGKEYPTHYINGRPIRSIFVNYIGLPYGNIYDFVKDSPLDEEEVPRVQCKYTKNGNQCITLLNSSSQKTEDGLCNLHRDKETEMTYTVHDSIWRCTVKVHDKRTFHLVECGKKANERTVLDGKETIRCPKHHKVWEEARDSFG